MYKYNASVNSHWGLFLKSNNYLQLIKDQMSGQKLLDVDIWMLAHLLLLHLHLPGSIKHCQSLHAHHAFNSLSKEMWDFTASITQQGTHMRTLIDSFIKIYMYIHIQTHKYIYFGHLLKKKRLHKGLI